MRSTPPSPMISMVSTRAARNEKKQRASEPPRIAR